MAQKKTKYFVIAPDGTRLTRTSHRLYTHAVVTRKGDSAWAARNWCGRPDLAYKALAEAERYGYTAQIIPAQVDA